MLRIAPRSSFVSAFVLVMALAACRPSRSREDYGSGAGGGQHTSGSDSGGSSASSSADSSSGAGGSDSTSSSASTASGGAGGSSSDSSGGAGGDSASSSTSASSGGIGGSSSSDSSGGSGGTSGAASTSAGCSSAGTATPCTGLPAFTGTQKLDGDDSDFCNVPGFELNFQNAAKVKEYNPNGKNSPERVLARVAWDASGIHAFIHVIDPKFVPAADLDNIWNADGVELLFSSTTSGLKGGTADDAAITTHVIASPPLVALSKASGSNGSQAPLDTKLYWAGTVSDGYAVEFNLPWPGTPPSAGSQIKFDMEMNAADGNSTNGDAGPRDAQAMLYVGSDPGGSPCGGELFPYCDDRLWCSTSLQ